MDVRHVMSALLDVASRLGVDVCLTFGLPSVPHAVAHYGVAHERDPNGDQREVVTA